MITDVPGILVGHTTRDERGWLTGCTVVVPPPGTVAGVDVRGGGPGTRETDLLDPRNLVDAVDAIVLSGGSAFGLATADGALEGSYAARRGWPVGPPGLDPPHVVPIVPAAILFDLGRGGGFRHVPGAADGRAAYESAGGGPVAEGNVGAGTGAVAGGLKGGVGSASTRLPGGVTVGALVVVNSMGSPVRPGGGELLGVGWGAIGETGTDPEAGGIPTPDPAAAAAYWSGRAAERAGMESAMEAALTAGTATTLGVVATDARLTKAQCQKLAGVAHDGLARAVAPVHTAFDGDAFFALATGARAEPDGFGLLDLQVAAADCVTRAIVRAMLAADSVDRSAEGGAVVPSWRVAMRAQIETVEG